MPSTEFDKFCFINLQSTEIMTCQENQSPINLVHLQVDYTPLTIQMDGTKATVSSLSMQSIDCEYFIQISKNFYSFRDATEIIFQNIKFTGSKNHWESLLKSEEVFYKIQVLIDDTCDFEDASVKASILLNIRQYDVTQIPSLALSCFCEIRCRWQNDGDFVVQFLEENHGGDSFNPKKFYLIGHN